MTGAFSRSKQQRTANIAEMERRLRARGIKVVIYDEEIPLRYYTFDFIHLTREGHAMIAAALLPRIMALARSRPQPMATDGKTPPAAR